MKSTCYHRSAKLRLSVSLSLLAFAGLSITAASRSPADQTPPPRPVRQVLSEETRAELLVRRTLQRLTLGTAFDAKLRQRIWIGGREFVGIGHYEQSGEGSGRFSLEMSIHEGTARQSMRQISDGKLAWTRTQVGDNISLRRVELGRLDEVFREAVRNRPLKARSEGGKPWTVHGATVDEPIPPRMRVGGLVELVDRISRDYQLRLTKGHVDGQPVWILRGTVTDEAKRRIVEAGGQDHWTALCPYEVRLAVAAGGDATQAISAGVPVCIEFWSAPVSRTLEAEDSDDAAAEGNRSQNAAADDSDRLDEPSVDRTAAGSPPGSPQGRLISMLEIYAVRSIQPSPEERFRFKGEDLDVTISNDTRRYLDRLAEQESDGRL